MFSVLLIALLAHPLLHAANATLTGDFHAERPALISLGFGWRIEGDDNRNAAVAASYRKKGESQWRSGPPLLRIGNERINENAFQYVVTNMFAGSIFDLDPGADDECRFVLSDPEGVSGITRRR